MGNSTVPRAGLLPGNVRGHRFALSACGLAASLLFAGGAHAACVATGNGNSINATDGGTCLISTATTYTQAGGSVFSITANNGSTVTATAPVTFTLTDAQYGVGDNNATTGATSTFKDVTANITGIYGGAIRLSGTTTTANSVTVNGTLTVSDDAQTAGNHDDQGIATYGPNDTIIINGPYHYSAINGYGHRMAYNSGGVTTLRAANTTPVRA